MKSSNEKVNTFLADIQATAPDTLEIIDLIRKAFFDENSKVEEDIKYGGITFHILDQLIGGIYLYKQHISIEFSNGAQFTDKGSLLEGGGKKRRHLKILVKSDITDKKITSYITQALNL